MESTETARREAEAVVRDGKRYVCGWLEGLRVVLYVEEDVDLVRTLEAVVCAEMLACLDHLVVLELVRVRLLACLPLTETYERASQASSRLQVSATGSKV